jgi:hypothetical protein
MNLRCSKAHVYNAINGKISGVSRLPAIPMGRRKLVRRSSLDEWKRANETGGDGITSIRQNISEARCRQQAEFESLI